jgi:MoxR-like ATPase
MAEMKLFETDWFDDLANKKKIRPKEAVPLAARRKEQFEPSGYLPDPGLADAIRVALILRRPLLLTGEPGTGKTDCARYLAWKLRYGSEPKCEPLIFEAKSTSEATDLFYTYDTLGRFQAKQSGEASIDPLDFIHYNALGEAILQAYPADAKELQGCLPKDGWEHRGPLQSVVLIDEIDKAPRDFPNDLLNEIDRSYFKIRELKNRKIDAPADKLPLVVITSNSEKNLPAAFLRRCIYYDIPFPKEDDGRLEAIVGSRLGEFKGLDSPLLKDAIQFLRYLREGDAGLQKVPATAELLDWLLYLTNRGADLKKGIRKQENLVKPSLVTLLKNEQDQKRRDEIWDGWIPPTP